MNDADKANVITFYAEHDVYYDIPEHLVDPQDNIVMYLDNSDDDEDSDE